MEILDALKLAKEIRPKLTIPIHYGIIPSQADAAAFVRAFTEEGIPVKLPDYCKDI